MSLIFMLCLVAGGTGFMCALTEGKHGGAHGVVIGLVIGVVAGLVGFFGMRMLFGKRVIQWMQLQKQKFQFIIGAFFCVIAFIWVMFSAFIGSWLTKLTIHLFQ